MLNKNQLTGQQVQELLDFFMGHVSTEDFKTYMDILVTVRDDFENPRKLNWQTLFTLLGKIGKNDIIVEFDPHFPTLIKTGRVVDARFAEERLRSEQHLDLKEGLKLFCLIDGVLTYVTEACNGLNLQTQGDDGRIGSYGSIEESSTYEKLVAAGLLHDLRSHLPLKNYRRNGGYDSAAERRWWKRVRTALLK